MWTGRHLEWIREQVFDHEAHNCVLVDYARAETVLYRVVREHLETFLAQTRETYERPLPRYVVAELHAYLR